MKEKLDILKKLEQDLISPEEAQKALKALKEKVQTRGKTFKVLIQSGDGDNVNIQIPLNLAKMFLAGKKSFVKSKSLSDYDLDFEEIMEILESGHVGEIVNIQSADGDHVRIVVE